jgi:hypothetical protein
MPYAYMHIYVMRGLLLRISSDLVRLRIRVLLLHLHLLRVRVRVSARSFSSTPLHRGDNQLT